MNTSPVCPLCRRHLNVQEESLLFCDGCNRSYSQIGGYRNFTDQAADYPEYETDQDMDALLAGEGASGGRFVQRYLSPKLEQKGLGGAKVLSVGCGVGEDVAELRRCGYEAYGVELWGLRASKWAGLGRSPQWYYVADARNLPFEDKAFDVVLCIGLTKGRLS